MTWNWVTRLYYNLWYIPGFAETILFCLFSSLMILRELPKFQRLESARDTSQQYLCTNLIVMFEVESKNHVHILYVFVLNCVYDAILYKANSVHLQNQFNFRIGIMRMHMGRRYILITTSTKVLLNRNFIHFPVPNTIIYYITENNLLYFLKIHFHGKCTADFC